MDKNYCDVKMYHNDVQPKMEIEMYIPTKKNEIL